MNRYILGLACAAWSLAAASAAAPSVVDQAQALMDRGQYQQALQQLDQHLKSHPQDAEARFERGLVLAKLGRSDDAIKTFSDLTRDYPQLPEPYNNLAVLYAQQGDYEKARDALEAALATHPAYATAHENLGDIYAALASAAYNRALMLDQNNEAVRRKLRVLEQLDSSHAHIAETPPVAPAPTPAPAPASATPSPASAPAAVATAPPPAALASAAPAVSAEDSAAVEQTLEDWAAAWSAQNVVQYLALYAPDFQPEGGLSRSAWEAQRRERVGRPSFVRVHVGDPRTAAIGAGRVRVTFQQRYESNLYSDTTTKELELRRDPGGWRIVREYVR